MMEDVIFAGKVLLPFDPDARCPKCAYDAVKTEYRSGAHGGCMGYYKFPVQYLSDYSVDLDALRVDADYRRSFPEHLDRTCARCSYAWAEAVAE